MNRETLLKILRREVKESLGCTEIAAIGLAVAAARGDQIPPYRIRIYLDYDTFRNAFCVGVPGGGQGIKEAVLKGLGGDLSKGLRVFEGSRKVSEKSLIDFKVEVVDVDKIFIYTIVNERSALIGGYHDNLVYVGPVKDLDFALSKVRHFEEKKLENTLENIDYSKIIEVIPDAVNDKRILAIIREGITMNMKLSEEGKRYAKYIFSTFSKYGKNLLKEMKFKTGIAIEARMRGIDLPAMSVAGSGNQGILATVPIVIYCKRKGLHENILYESILLSWLTTIYLTAYLGRLSPFCGLLSKAGSGLTAGLAYAIGKEKGKESLTDIVESAVVNYLSSIFGSFCDGAKPSCALKGISSINVAYNAAMLANNGTRISPIEGYLPIKYRDIVKDYLENLRVIKEEIGKGYQDAFIKILYNKMEEL